jgi:hypothetical protein
VLDSLRDDTCDYDISSIKKLVNALTQCLDDTRLKQVAPGLNALMTVYMSYVQTSFAGIPSPTLGNCYRFLTVEITEAPGLEDAAAAAYKKGGKGGQSNKDAQSASRGGGTVVPRKFGAGKAKQMVYKVAPVVKAYDLQTLKDNILCLDKF